MTDKPQHSPGPWRAAYSEKRDNYQIWSKDRHWIANTKCESTPRDHEANAHLIAAAPELLEALKWVRLNYASGPTAEINARIDAAVAKAEGRA